MIYCVKCKDHTGEIELIPHVSKNGRPMVKGKCSICGITKNKFVSNKDVKEGGSLATLFKGLLPMIKTAVPKVLKTLIPILGLSAVSGAVSGATRKKVEGSGRKRRKRKVTDRMIRKYARDNGYEEIRKGSGIWSFIKGIFT